MLACLKIYESGLGKSQGKEKRRKMGEKKGIKEKEK